MPEITLTTTNENAVRLVAAIEHSGFRRDEGEASLDYVSRFLRYRLIGLVHVMEEQMAAEGVVLDEGVVT